MVLEKMVFPGDNVNINLNVVGGEVVTIHAKKVSFQLVSMNKSSVSKPKYAVTTLSMGNTFNKIYFNLKRHFYL